MQTWTPSQSIRQANKSLTKLSHQIPLRYSTTPRNEQVVRKHASVHVKPLVRKLDNRPIDENPKLRNRSSDRSPKPDLNGNAGFGQYRRKWSEHESHGLPGVEGLEDGNVFKETATQDNGSSGVDPNLNVLGTEPLKVRHISNDRAFAQTQYLKSINEANGQIHHVGRLILKPSEVQKEKNEQDNPKDAVGVSSKHSRYLKSVTAAVEDISPISGLLSKSSEAQTSKNKHDDPTYAIFSPSQHLPKPPFMQADMRRGRKLVDFRADAYDDNEPNPFRLVTAGANGHIKERSQLARGKRPQKMPNNVFHLAQKRSLKDNLTQAPFSTLLNQNPYAHALAVPVREDCFTGAHLPNTCLLDFHVADTGPESDEICLLPISLAAELVSKKKVSKIRAEEEMALAAQQDNSSFAPRGAASYMLGTKAAVDFVTEVPHKRVRSMVVSRRVNAELSNQEHSSPLTWRKDMGDFVLEGMQKAVVKKISWLFRAKSSKNKSGMLFEILPGVDETDLSRINDEENPSCILELTMPRGSGSHDPTAEQNDVAANAIDSADITSHEDLHLEQTTADASVYPLGKTQEVDENDEMEEDRPAAEEDEFTNDESTSGKPSTPTTRPPKALKRQIGWWVASKTETLHAGTKPLPPPFRPLLTKYPTLLFHNRAIPIYNLPQLLGVERTAKLIQDTVFKNSKYVALGIGQGTVPAQVWLLRLQMYLADERSYKAMRRERKHMKEWTGEAGGGKGDEDVDLREIDKRGEEVAQE